LVVCTDVDLRQIVSVQLLCNQSRKREL
jgi:hypothetical protein